jgi:cation diffusion facilitator family transporter
MTAFFDADPALPGSHHHVFLGKGHEQNERRTWAVIALCCVMMVVEIFGGLWFGSLALVADGLHMSTHASALLLAALAYAFARRHATDPRFTFGTGKLGDLAGFTSAIILAMIGLLIAYEAVNRVLHPVSIDYREALVIAGLGLLVNIASAWLLSGGDHGHRHEHGEHGEASHTEDDTDRAGTATRRDNNLRSALAHILADAAVSVLVIIGLLLGLLFGFAWMDPLVGIVGAVVIGAWAVSLVRNTGSILLDTLPDSGMADRLCRTIEADGDRLADLHLWRLGPGHLGAIVTVVTDKPRDSAYYRQRLQRFPDLSHLTIEVWPSSQR